MSKEQRGGREPKKKALKTLKEKRAEKHSKNDPKPPGLNTGKSR